MGACYVSFERSLKFYCGVLGMPLFSVLDLVIVIVLYAFLSASKNTVQIYLILDLSQCCSITFFSVDYRCCELGSCDELACSSGSEKEGDRYMA